MVEIHVSETGGFPTIGGFDIGPTGKQLFIAVGSKIYVYSDGVESLGTVPHTLNCTIEGLLSSPSSMIASPNAAAADSVPISLFLLALSLSFVLSE